MLDLPIPPEWEVRRITAVRAHKDYTCPGCGNVVPAGTGHVVAWPHQLSDLRRHWHHHCWRLAVRRDRLWPTG